MYKIIQKRKIFYTISIALVSVSLIGWFLWGLKYGIDFTGGSLMDVSYSQARPDMDQLKNSFKDLGVEPVIVQPSGDKDYIFRFKDVPEAKHQEILQAISQIKIENVSDNKLTENKFESIGPSLGKELKSKAFQAIIIVLIFIVLYIAYAFRKVSKPVESWKYGVAAIIALTHDIIIVTGVFVFLGKFMGVEVDSLFVTALLTILGFSVHDTIVTFDRLRENLFKSRTFENFEEIINISINQTMIRSINTSLTTFLALLAILLFGGESTRYLALALSIGIIIGTYSSIFVASPLLLLFNKKR
ncbi:MAG: Protein-export rane protein SecF [Patescibacteria group bacterium]|nr:Protein-export rane protein SecF [Patescibacteria group bacterium]MDQ5970338.1 Protein-export rane protein SecF [Patescibacteria group bacterium]